MKLTFPKAMEIIEGKKYFRPVFHSVFCTLPIMQYNLLINHSLFGFSAPENKVRQLSCPDLMNFHGVMTKTNFNPLLLLFFGICIIYYLV